VIEVVKCPNCGNEIEGGVRVSGVTYGSGSAEVKGNTISNLNWDDVSSIEKTVVCENCEKSFTIDKLGLKWA